MKRYAISIILCFTGICAAAQETVLDLAACRELAAERNSTIAGARYELQAAEYQRAEARGEWFPRVSFNALGFASVKPLVDLGVKDLLGHGELGNMVQNVVDVFAPQLGISDPRFKAVPWGYSAGFSLIQPVYAGGRIANGNRLAELGVEAAKLQGEVKTREENGNLDELFYQVISLQEKRKTLRSALKLVDRLLSDVSAAYASGLVTEDELLQVQLKRNELLSSSVQLESGLKLSKMNLLNNIGMPYSLLKASAAEGKPYIDDFSFTAELAEPLPPISYFVDEETVAASMLEAQLLELNVEAKQLEKRMEMGGTLPQLALGATYGYSDIGFSGRFNGAAFATLQVPISDWGKTSMKMKRLQSGIDKAKDEQEYLNSQLRLQVSKLWVDLCTAWDEYRLKQEAVEMSGAAYARMEARYNAGQITASQLLESETSLRGCEDELSEALCNYRKALEIWRRVAGV